MTKLVINPSITALIDAYSRLPSHAIILSGVSGVGLSTIAHHLASSVVEGSHVIEITPEKNTIPIDRIRQLYEQTRSIQSGGRCIIIDDADAMGVEAQNALLKLLEEPVENIYFILTTHLPSEILPTIASRVQWFRIPLVSEALSLQVLDNYDLDSKKRSQLLFLASGRPAELIRLSSDNDYFNKQALTIADARQLLQASMYERLSVVKKYTDRESALQLLVTTSNLLGFSLLKQKNHHAADLLPHFSETIDHIVANGHVRTHLMHLVTKLN